MKINHFLNVLSRTLITVIFLAISSKATEAQDKLLEREMLSAFQKWSNAMNEGDLKKWQESTATFRKVGIRNMIVSQKNKWPESLFDTQVSPPKIDAMKKVKLMVNGPTAQLVYYGQPNFGVNEAVEVPDGLLFLMFVKENEKWKFGTSRFMNLNNTEEITAAAKSGDFSFLESPQFMPPSKAPTIPKICPIPELVGYIEIISIGYETTVKVEERSTHMVIDNVHKGLILGGLKKGVNQLFVDARELKKRPDNVKNGSHLEINVYKKSNLKKEPLKLLYSTNKLKNGGKIKIIVRGDV